MHMKQAMRHMPINKNLQLYNKATNNKGLENTYSPTPFAAASSPEYLLHRQATSDDDQDGSTQKWRCMCLPDGADDAALGPTLDPCWQGH
ncbi:hypothetical protein LOK49_LG11G00603 [Camellia lanceoleosa]|uniref:Uncharacterized protein n=1 Tax=Camellia lanceoleosa TaxID=1840588 RepID=A0ACC0G111_9ERIC|nr:hypothetical protein LOK49_LG11G00603 [Camellia lanceoleosa]